jgi:hypothetical protein
MNILLIILSVVAGLVVLLLVVAYFAPRGYVVQREIVVHCPRRVAYDYLRHIKNQVYFNVYRMRDAERKETYRGEDGTVGFVYAWDGDKKAGAGEQVIKALEEDKRIDLEMRFIRPFAAMAVTTYLLESPSAGETKIVNSMEGSLNYPMNVMLLFMNTDKMMGRDMDVMLGNLKGILSSAV